MTTGHYIVNGEVFYSKSKAAYKASQSNTDLKWYFYDDLWFNLLQNVPIITPSLDELYKQRAQQLRDKYNYLILNYSGGADSHNVLMSFLKNNIKLDEIYVQRSSTVDEKIYSPNTLDTSAANLFSEWDYTIKPTLDWISKEYPDIKINIHDIFNTSTVKIYDDIGERAGQFLGAFEILRQSSYSDSIQKCLDKGKTVADIYGIDKPFLIIKDNILFGFFTDASVNVADKIYSLSTKYSPELFYWSIDCPLIFYAQSRVVLEYLNKFSENRKLFEFENLKRAGEYDMDSTRKLLIPLIYNTWDNKFQTGKPVTLSTMGRSRDKFYLHHNEFDIYKDRWQYNYSSWYTGLDEKFLTANKTQQRICRSTWFKIGALTC
jgi:hypothetical protein